MVRDIRPRRFRRWVLAICLTSPLSMQPAMAAQPTADQALGLTPIQSEIDYDRPQPEEAAKCTIKAETIEGGKGWIVRNPNGQVLRKFVDTNNDNVVDLWCYFRAGIEVYRDADTNHNGKADQYRWLNTAGSRWGFDENEDGKVDRWQTISAEEVTAEVVAALVDKDENRFAALLPSADELKSLGLGEEKLKDLTAKIAAAKGDFKEVARQQKLVAPGAVWLQFGGTRPGRVPSGTEGSTKDLLVYENSIALVESEEKTGQVPIGTLIQIGDAWRLANLPPVLGDKTAALGDAGYFFQTSAAVIPDQVEGTAGAPDQKMQELLAKLEELDKSAPKSTDAAELGKLNAARADILEQIAAAATGDDRLQWIRQLADTMSAAAQAGQFADGVKRLQTLAESLKKESADSELLAYVTFRAMSAEYGQAVQAENADFGKVQEKWLADLDQYVKDYPKSPDAAEALLQLGIAKEFAGQDQEAIAFYGRLASEFPQAPSAPKAQGAKTRLTSVGKPITLKGQGVDGKPVDLAKYRGKIVLVHYWATWCEPCKADMAQLKELKAKYGKPGFELIGVNLDTNAKDAAEYLKQNKLPWAQIYEPGGLESRLANELGILTLPTMILIDEKGNVVDRNIHITQVDSELKKRIK